MYALLRREIGSTREGENDVFRRPIPLLSIQFSACSSPSRLTPRDGDAEAEGIGGAAEKLAAPDVRRRRSKTIVHLHTKADLEKSSHVPILTVDSRCRESLESMGRSWLLLVSGGEGEEGPGEQVKRKSSPVAGRLPDRKSAWWVLFDWLVGLRRLPAGSGPVLPGLHLSPTTSRLGPVSSLDNLSFDPTPT